MDRLLRQLLNDLRNSVKKLKLVVHKSCLIRADVYAIMLTTKKTSKVLQHVVTVHLAQPSIIIIHQTHYEKSDWSRAFNQFIIACELDMINAKSAADIAFIMSSSTSAWLLSPLECSPQKQNGRTLRFCF